MRKVGWLVVLASAACANVEQDDEPLVAAASDLDGLKSYEILDIDLAAAAARARSSGELQLAIAGVTYTLRLQPHDLMAADYRATIGTRDGFVPINRPATSTYRGYVVGDGGSDVRLLVQPDLMLGYVHTGKQWIFLEPLDRYEPDAPPERLIAYRDTDVAGLDLRCGTEDASHGTAAHKLAATQSSTTPNLRVIEIATDIDSDLYRSFSSNLYRTLGYVQGILNETDGMYRSQLGFTLRLTTQNVWTTYDPYTLFGTVDYEWALLQLEVWQAAIANRPWDVAHLFTGKDFPGFEGNSDKESVCVNRVKAHAVMDYSGFGIARMFRVPAHEIGHVLGSHHDQEYGVDCQGPDRTLMCDPIGDETFSQPSKDAIAAFVGAHGSCLDTYRNAQFFTTSHAAIGPLGPAQTWRDSWDIIVPGRFGGVGTDALLMYDRSRGEGEVYTTNAGNIAMLRAYSGWRTTWDAIVPGEFGADGHTDLLFYDRAAGQFELYTTDGNGNLSQLGPTHGNWGNDWTHIIPGNFGGDARTDLLFYAQGTGRGQFYTTTGTGNLTTLTPLGGAHSWRRSWNAIVPGDFGGDSRTDLLYYDRQAGQGEFYTTNGTGAITLLRTHNNWRRTWDHLIPGDFGGLPSRTNLLFYDRTTGQAEAYGTDGNGFITMLGTTQQWRPEWADIIVPGVFLNIFHSTDLLVYER